MSGQPIPTDSPRTRQPDWLLNFLGQSPRWYKVSVLGFLLVNPILLFLLGESGPIIVSWLLIGEFIFTLAMALKCYPLQPGGLLALEAVALGLTEAETVYQEAHHNFPVILLLMFMVAGIYFMKDLLLFTFTKLLLGVRSKTALSVAFIFSSAVLSAFLDALTVTAVLISVAVGFYNIYHKVVSQGQAAALGSKAPPAPEETWSDQHRDDLDQFRSFLRSLLMHGAVGTALGGVMTMVGEPQNLLIAHEAKWGFVEFFLRMLPVTGPVLIAGILTCIALEKTQIVGYGAKIPKTVLEILTDYSRQQDEKMNSRARLKLATQAIVALALVAALATHLAEVGLIGLGIIVVLTAFNGITEEHQLGKAFEEAMPFTALLVVFFTIVAVIHTQHLFSPIIHLVLSMDESVQPGMLFVANGFLSAISDNVFVATIYITEVREAFDHGLISLEHFNRLTIAINAGTNLPSVATPNGQAAFLFLLTSAVAPLVRLSYGRMVYMALPYTVVLSILGFIGVAYFV